MKNSTKKILTTLILITIISLTVKAQTNVSGGIYSNTTWTKANSPYIVIDTIVVFPNITLTVEPGVVVKFENSKYMELRQASLIAIGTATDSITFTSNSVSPIAGSWGQIIQTGVGSHTCKLAFCNFRYANIGFQANATFGISDTIFVKHSNFEFNVNGFHGIGAIEYIDSCRFFYNTQDGLAYVKNINNSMFFGNNRGITSSYSNINNCVIDSNQTGVYGFIHTISNSIIRNNQTGVSNLSGSLIIDNCIINKNQTGLYLTGNSNQLIYSVIDSNSIAGVSLYGSGNQGSFVNNCQINYNEIGIYDSYCAGGVITKNQIENNNIGIVLETYQDTIYCNEICNNATWGLKYIMTNNTNSVVNNYWCTPDSASTETIIYDGYDNILYGLVSFMPIDTVQCYLFTGIPMNEIKTISVFPNPFNDELSISINNQQPVEVILYDLTSRIILHQTFTNSTILNTQHLVKGMYLYEVRNKTSVIKKGKVVKD